MREEPQLDAKARDLRLNGTARPHVIEIASSRAETGGRAINHRRRKSADRGHGGKRQFEAGLEELVGIVKQESDRDNRQNVEHPDPTVRRSRHKRQRKTQRRPCDGRLPPAIRVYTQAARSATEQAA